VQSWSTVAPPALRIRPSAPAGAHQEERAGCREGYRGHRMIQRCNTHFYLLERFNQGAGDGLARLSARRMCVCRPASC
jgi:hypothetical protein